MLLYNVYIAILTLISEYRGTVTKLEGLKRRPEGGEWEPQISFETFDRCPKINPQKAHKQMLRKLEPQRVKRP
jgi:hypothetical protein